MYCFAVYHCLLLRAYQAILGYSLPKTLSPGVASGVLVTSCSLAALITQATATASLSCRNASRGASRLRNPTAPLGCKKLPSQELQECPGQVQLALLSFDYN